MNLAACPGKISSKAMTRECWAGMTIYRFSFAVRSIFKHLKSVRVAFASSISTGLCCFRLPLHCCEPGVLCFLASLQLYLLIRPNVCFECNSSVGVVRIIIFSGTRCCYVRCLYLRSRPSVQLLHCVYVFKVISDIWSRFCRLTVGKVDYDATFVRFGPIEQIKTFESCSIFKSRNGRSAVDLVSFARVSNPETVIEWNRLH